MATMNEQLDRDSAPIVLVVGADAVGRRLDQFVAQETELTRSAVARLIEDCALTCNQASTDKNYRLRLGDTLEIRIPEPELCEAIAQDIPLIFEYPLQIPPLQEQTLPVSSSSTEEMNTKKLFSVRKKAAGSDYYK